MCLSTHTLFETSLDRAFDRTPPKFRTYPLGRTVTGAFAVSDQGAIWIGDYEPSGPSKAFKFTLSTIENLAEETTLSAEAASVVVPIPSYCQGGSIDSSQRFWIARSDIGWGFLDMIDPVTGTLEQRYAVPAGIEGVAFEDSKLWAVSEAGVRHLPWPLSVFSADFPDRSGAAQSRRLSPVAR